MSGRPTPEEVDAAQESARRPMALMRRINRASRAFDTTEPTA